MDYKIMIVSVRDVWTATTKHYTPASINVFSIHFGKNLYKNNIIEQRFSETVNWTILIVRCT